MSNQSPPKGYRAPGGARVFLMLALSCFAAGGTFIMVAAMMGIRGSELPPAGTGTDWS